MISESILINSVSHVGCLWEETEAGVLAVNRLDHHDSFFILYLKNNNKTIRGVV